MNIEEFRDYCLSFKGTEDCLPFDENTLVFKVMGKMFAATGLAEFRSVNLKCDPERALELRASHDAIQPGYHMNKKHWNTVLMDGTLSDDFIKELVKHSYDLVVSKMTKKMKAELEALA